MSIIEDRIERLCGDITELRLKLARYMNPYTIEIQNAATGIWSNLLHDAPKTFQDAEKDMEELQATFPKAKFRVVPWLNPSQWEHIRSGWERKL